MFSSGLYGSGLFLASQIRLLYSEYSAAVLIAQSELSNSKQKRQSKTIATSKKCLIFAI